jgi:hypothetical protein
VVDRIARFVTPRREGLRILDRSRILRPSRRGVTKRIHSVISTEILRQTEIEDGLLLITRFFTVVRRISTASHAKRARDFDPI